MDKLTLDTNVLRDWAWHEGKSTETRYTKNAEAKRKELKLLFERLITLRDTGMCELGITTRLYTDYGKGARELPQHIKDMIGPYVSIATPCIFGLPLVLPFVLPDNETVQRVFKDVFPHSEPGHKKYANNQKDAWQLYAHQVANRDIFITEDDGILRMRAVLAENWSIRVKSLTEYVSEPSETAYRGHGSAD